MERIVHACINTWNGLLAATRSEAAFRQELVALALAIPLAFLITSEPWKRGVLVAVVLLVLVIELLNTAIEKLCDQVTTASHPEIGRIKDMGSAAVGVMLAVAGLLWLTALGERLALW